MKLPYGALMVRGKSPSCEICWKGGKLVLFITGVCDRYSTCFYCTISPEKRGSDLILADEIEVRREEDVLREASLIEAEGAGITGGEPSLVVERVFRYIKLLKDSFGRDFDVHLYTNSSGIDQNSLKKLKSAGLDEIRFHTWEKDEWKKIKLALDFDMRVGAEMPAIPKRSYEKRLIELASFLDSIGAHFLNLNELEFSEGNREDLLSRGYWVREDSGIAVLGSREAAIRVLKFIDKETGILGYFCSSQVKELQVLNRWRRRARNVAKPYQEVTDQGTLIFGEIRGDIKNILRLRDFLGDEACELREGKLFVSPDFIFEMKEKISSMGLKGEIVEVAPLDFNFEISRRRIV